MNFQVIKTGIDVVVDTLYLAKKLKPDDYYIERCFREAISLQIKIRDYSQDTHSSLLIAG